MDKNELKQSVASLMKDRSQREAFAEMLTEYIQPGHITTDFVSMLLNTRALKLGDQLVKKVRKGIRVHSFVPGTIPLRSEITVSERMNYTLDTYHVGVLANEFELASGEIGSVDEIKNEVAAKLRDYLYGKIFTMLTTIWTEANTPIQFTDVGAPVTKAALDNMIEAVGNRAPSVKAIAGVRSALLPITEFAGWSTYSSTNHMAEFVSEELARTGWVGQYKGVPLVVIPQDRNNPEDDTILVPTDKILVIGDMVGEYITYGSMNPVEYTDNRIIPPQWNYSVWGQHGMIVDNADNLGVLKIV